MLISVVIPIYNQEYNVLSECIQSVIDQSYYDLEIILCNNHSDNGTEALINKYREIDQRIRIVKPFEFLNLGDSFLFSLEQASAEYICYLSSDDILEKNCIKVQLEFLQKNKGVDICHGKSVHFNDEREEIKWDYYPKTGVYELNNQIVTKIINFEYICFCGCLIKNDKLRKIINIYKQKPFKLAVVLDTYILGELVKDSSIGFVDNVVGFVRTGHDISHRLRYVFEDCFNIFNDWQNSCLVNNFFNINEFNFIKEKYFSYIYLISLRSYLYKKLNKDDFLLIRNFVLLNKINIKKRIMAISFFTINYRFLALKLFDLYKFTKNILKLKNF